MLKIQTPKRLHIEIDYNSICNLSCDYCILKVRKPEDKYAIGKRRLSLQDITEFIIRYMRENNLKRVKLRFTSCEPMIILPHIVMIVGELFRHGFTIDLNLVTNATTYDASYLGRLREMCNVINMVVSIDTVNGDYQHFRKYKDGTPVSTQFLLQNAFEIENILGIKAIYSSVITDQTYDDIINQLNYFKDIGRTNLLQFDNTIVNKIDKNSELFKLVSQCKESDCSMDCILHDDSTRICIDWYGNIYKCRAHKTIGEPPILNIDDYNGGPIIPKFDKVLKFYKEHPDSYIKDYCPLLLLNSDDLKTKC